MGLFGLFGGNDTASTIKEYLEKGAVIIDVRTQMEWDEAHIDSAKHIVLDTIPHYLEEIKALNKPVIAVCKSGGRSEAATNFLVKNNIDAINGGPWQNVANQMG